MYVWLCTHVCVAIQLGVGNTRFCDLHFSPYIRYKPIYVYKSVKYILLFGVVREDKDQNPAIVREKHQEVLKNVHQQDLKIYEPVSAASIYGSVSKSRLQTRKTTRPTVYLFLPQKPLKPLHMVKR